jgi:hypothetical protein
MANKGLGLWQRTHSCRTSECRLKINGAVKDMDIDPLNIQLKPNQNKRQKFKPVLQTLIEGLATLVESQTRFAEEFGFPHRRVFNDHSESLNGKNTKKVISRWIKDGDEGADKLRALFDDLTQHQAALLKATDEVANESMSLSKSKKDKFADLLGMDVTEYTKKHKSDYELHRALHQHLVLIAFTNGYSKARDEMSVK